MSTHSSAAWPKSGSNHTATNVANLGVTANLTAITAHAAATAVGAVFDDLAAARTAVNTLRTDIEVALTANDSRDTTLRSETEARLDAIEAKLDALLTSLRAGTILV